MFFNHIFTDLIAEILNHVGDIIIGHKFKTLFENLFALIIHDVIIFQQVFANIEITLLDANLRAFNRFGHETAGNIFAFFHTHFSKHIFKTVTAKNPHKIIFCREIELRPSRIALTARTST